MMPDLGRYAAEVMLAYGVSLTLIAGLVGWVWARGARVRQELETLERRHRRKD